MIVNQIVIERSTFDSCVADRAKELKKWLECKNIDNFTKEHIMRIFYRLIKDIEAL